MQSSNYNNAKEMFTEEQQVVSIIKENQLYGTNLLDENRQNQIYLLYLAKHIDCFGTLKYKNSKIMEAANKWVKIEEAYRFAYNVVSGLTVILGYEYLIQPDFANRDRKNKKVKYVKYEELDPKHKVVIDVMAEESKKLPINPASHSTKLMLRCWKRQDKDFAAFLDENQDGEIQAMIGDGIAKALSIPRLVRFTEDEIRKKYGLK